MYVNRKIAFRGFIVNVVFTWCFSILSDFIILLITEGDVNFSPGVFKSRSRKVLIDSSTKFFISISVVVKLWIPAFDSAMWFALSLSNKPLWL